ncbi:uncharacterized protein LOC115397138 isoform X1 [Salarias fasciatus]|uniref:uncharacterized protein LOC115397138 isoform X1 n=1 Tax=Salarias fasciatus TaxID=181472 RepID=UPI00117680AE|nr:uncharacterized protein LOC115397138 isoform X1 [Salarias fasciatus]
MFMHNGFISIYLLIIWNSPIISGNSSAVPLRFLLGCEAVIPCRPVKSLSDSFKWFFKKSDQNDQIKIFFQDKNRKRRYSLSHKRGKVKGDRSLVISNFTELDQGSYWCESCDRTECKKSTVFRVTEDIWEETNTTVHVVEGKTFEQVCPGEIIPSKWTFEAQNLRDKSSLGPESNALTFNKSIRIRDVKTAHAGRYTCWTRGCRRAQKLLTVCLCVLRAHQRKDSSSCALTCDEESWKIASDTVINTSISSHVKPDGPLLCSSTKTFDENATVTSSYVAVNAYNTTTGREEPKHQTPVRYIVPLTVSWLMIITLSFLFYRSRLWAAYSNRCRCGGNDNAEEEDSVVYSTILIRTQNKETHHNISEYDCIYSEINV